MNAPVSPAFFPAVEMRLRFFQALEAHPFERRSLRVADAGLHFPFPIGIFDPARHGHRSVVSEDVSKKWVDGGIVEVGNRYAFFQVVENYSFGQPPSRRNACSCSSAQVRTLDRQVSKRTDLRL